MERVKFNFNQGGVHARWLYLVLCISGRASEPKRQKHSSAQKVGFPPIPESAPKSAENRTFCVKNAHLLRKKCGFPHFFGTLSEISGNPTFVQIKVFAVWALRLDRKYTIIRS